ncbi:hypothetical protein Q5P01_026422 [Channa striata]|uniref:C-type lectin domain-containing protein n=1 Tax=Channa striata TaxID=64152 RepID=A0AA88LH29_CHASR|nr:hypothetical protein Q5P01_026422 [Channa striata]
MVSVHREMNKFTMDYENQPDAAAASKRRSTAVTPAQPGIKFYRLIGVSFGLLCILQAALNISLRLTLSCVPSDRSDNKSSSCKVLSEEVTELKRKLNNINHYAQQEWVYFHPSLYYVSSTKKSWQDSRDDCLQRGADLVIISSEKEQNFTKKFEKPAWIGLTYRREQDIWVWVDGTPLTTSYWHPGEPNNYQLSDENCAEHRFDDIGGSWNDEQTEPSTQLNIMDELVDIYINVENLSRNLSIRSSNSSEGIYENVLLQNEGSKGTGPALSDADVKAVEKGKKSQCRAAAPSLGFLCLLLLVGLVAVLFLLMKSNSKQEVDTLLLQTTADDRTCRQSALKMTAATAGRNTYRLVAVSFGLVCILQIALNITLRLLIYKDTVNMEASLKNLTEERDDLQRKLIDFVTGYCFQPGWVCFSGSMYYISSIKKTWEESKSDCEQRGAHLMIINSREEQNFTRMLKDNLWIGLTDRETEGTWKWVDGTPLATSFWASNEPNSYKDKEEDCTEVRSPDLRGEDAKITVHGTGMKGGTLLKCVAVSFCLLCIIQAALNVSLRLALNIDSHCKNLSDARDELKRINIVAALQLKSFTEERDDMKKQLNIYASQQTSLAEERDELKKKLDDFIHYSQQGWVYFSSSFYQVSSTQKTWTQSRDDCLEKSADLMIINSKEENDFSRQFKNVIWIGLSDRETEGVWKWVDGTLLTESFWSSGEPNNYNKRNEDCAQIWHYGSEDSWNDASRERRREVILNKGWSVKMSEEMYGRAHFEDTGTSRRNSGEKLYRLVAVSFGLLCVLQAAVNITLHIGQYSCEEKTINTEAILNMTKERDELKRKLTIFESWNGSRKDCQQRNADLVIVNSNEEQTFINQLGKEVWIGISDQETEGTWKWVDGTLLTTSYWGINEPNSHEGKDEDCGEIKFYAKENSWNDKPCDSENVWICEKMAEHWSG